MNLTQSIQQYLQEEIKTGVLHTDSKAYNYISNYVNIMNLLAQKSLRDTLKRFNPSSLYKKVYLQLDNRNAAYFDGNKTVWYLTTTKNIRQGFINIHYPLRDIVQIRLMNSYIYANFMYEPTWSSNADFSSRRIAFYIEELGNQSFTLNTGIKYHALGFTNRIAATETPTVITYVPDQAYKIVSDERFNHGIYQFANPVSLLDKITLHVNDLKLNIPLYERTIDLLQCTYLNLINVGYMRLGAIVTDNRFPTSVQTCVKNVSLPDITTDDPVTDSSWIEVARASPCFMYYSYQAVTIHITELIGTPTGNIQPFTVRFTVGLKIMTEFEITYMDTNI